MKRGKWGPPAPTPAVDLAGLRSDGRRPFEVRQIRCSMGVVRGADGSAYLEQGNTAVLVTVHGPKERVRTGPPSSNNPGGDHVFIACEFSQTLIGVPVKRKRIDSSTAMVSRSKPDRRLSEYASTVRAVFESVIVADGMKRSQIDILVHLLQTDGGHLSAAINCASLALMNAGIPTKDFVCCCSVGFVGGYYLVDMNSSELKLDRSELLIAVLAKEQTVVLAEMDSGGCALDVLDNCLTVGTQGCLDFYATLSELVKMYMETQRKSMAL
mmetsp:Transcript_21701/g.37360  ORF Transcript_21701/g.37360 Transcript_21701/m.37360 type:complete len:269 (+) Transcript_21701:85-891(+)|eukprot:CAMPEP_0184695850 /NCGR_PEP_ID=MMETSP0313-20130426/3352_1 /TAXON_ID=2792 /ORGANISM="Porphyridium aerugineum, Strain SAG 1380-2" /LENGTH=268 /DNA_ID=CAMNT_0027154377 /DNA_START=33 /DNA_END=839 /DNA_ORIENTATION=+